MKLLPYNRYHLLFESIKKVEINNLFARAVIEQNVTGKIYVDHILKPETFYVLHPYGMSLLYGNCDNDSFNQEFKAYALNLGKNRDQNEWMQAYPGKWDKVLHNLFGNTIIPCTETPDKINRVIEVHTRVNFRFNKALYLKKSPCDLPYGSEIMDTNRLHFEQMSGSVIPLKFWDTANDFLQKGKGFTIIHNREIASTAYTAYVFEDKMEIGIETVEKYRGFGFAEIACCKFIDYCIERNLIPVWSCRLENTPSFKLAQKLGFEPVRMFPFYKLCN